MDKWSLRAKEAPSGGRKAQWTQRGGRLSAPVGHQGFSMLGASPTSLGWLYSYCGFFFSFCGYSLFVPSSASFILVLYFIESQFEKILSTF